MYEQPGGKSTYEQSNSSQSPFADNSRYSSVPSVGPTQTYSTAPQLPRQSFDAYGAFSDPAPSGFASANTPPAFAPPSSPPPENPRVSRTMQYADPYARVRDAVSGTGSPPPAQGYSSYTSYQ